MLQELITNYNKDAGHDDDVRVVNLCRLVGEANELTSGHYLEIGVLRGLSLRVIHACMDHNHSLIGIDTFEGFTAEDVEIEHVKVPGCPWHVGNFVPTSTDMVLEHLGVGGLSNVILIKGHFPSCFVRALDENSWRWRFVHLDVDLYEPTAQALRLVWPHMVPGGIILMHDYQVQVFACRIAMDEFCEGEQVKFEQLTDKFGSVVIRKPAVVK